jgi:hypothetical protein
MFPLILRVPSWSRFGRTWATRDIVGVKYHYIGYLPLSGLSQASCRRIPWVTNGLARNQKFDPAILLAPSGVVV